MATLYCLGNNGETIKVCICSVPVWALFHDFCFGISWIHEEGTLGTEGQTIFKKAYEQIFDWQAQASWGHRSNMQIKQSIPPMNAAALGLDLLAARSKAPLWAGVRGKPPHRRLPTASCRTAELQGCSPTCWSIYTNLYGLARGKGRC